jgi:hypothetical protein
MLFFLIPAILSEAYQSSIILYQGSWKTLRKLENKLGDTFLLVNPVQLYLKTSNAELVTQITTRRIDFTKPTEYGLVDIFGKSILTQEGQEWRRHRKIVGPSFSEKSNRLVFEESLSQTESMMKLWTTQGTNTKAELKVGNTSEDAATLSLHVICAAGFGVPQVWPNETEENLEEKGLQAFSKFKLTGGHTLSFKDALIQLLKHIFWFVLFTPSMLSMFWSETRGGVLSLNADSVTQNCHHSRSTKGRIRHSMNAKCTLKSFLISRRNKLISENPRQERWI